MPQRRNAKIIATLGPASQTMRQIEALHRQGVDVFRLNFSHGTHDILKDLIAIIREVEKKRGHPIGILMDLQGPKLRIGTFQDGKINLKTGDRFRLDKSKKAGDDTRVSLPHPEVFSALKVKHDLLLDDGRIRLRVEKKNRDYIETRVVTGGVLSDHKGLNVPDTVLALPALTTKDRRDLRFAIKSGADWVGLSFVQRPADVAEVQAIAKGRVGVVAKLEKPAALEELNQIIDLADAVMVARGDLGVEMPPERVPSVQKRIVRHCRFAGKPVIVATQMLESMISAPAPTRAEASDVATAIYDGADAVMLSAETAVGSFGKEAVGMMKRIIERVEADHYYWDITETTNVEDTTTASDAITAAAASVAHTISAAAIVTYTTSGSTALRAAHQRPDVPILCLTTRRSTARRMTAVWGLHPVVTGDVRSFTEMVARAARIAEGEKLARVGQRLVVTAGVPFGTPGATNVLRIFTVPSQKKTERRCRKSGK